MFASMLRRTVAILSLGSVTAASGTKSDPVGIYALVDRVVLEPDAANPKTIQIWGVFALTNGQPGNDYRPAQRGYLYYSLESTLNLQTTRSARAEAADLKAIAGTGQPIGFGSRYAAAGRVRAAGESPANPDPYPLGVGVVKMPTMWTQGGTERELAAVPLPLTPAEGAVVPAGAIRLVVRNTRLPGVQYVFEVVGPGSHRSISGPISAGTAQTEWTPPLQLRAGESYTWRVWVTDGTWRGQPSNASLRVGP